MLREIHIQNYAVIESLSVEFHAGLNVLSGETGSGKSILVDALGLALGGRASPDVIRTGQERATVSVVFRSDGRPPWTSWLEEFGLAAGTESEIILRREIQAGGKSRLLVNDQPVTLAAVKTLASLLVEVHGQSEHVSLLEKAAQLDLLDQFAGAEELLQSVGKQFAHRRELQREMESLSQNEQDRLRTIDLLSFQARELDRAQLAPGEDARLEDEKRVLANLEKIRAAAHTASDVKRHLWPAVKIERTRPDGPTPGGGSLGVAPAVARAEPPTAGKTALPAATPLGYVVEVNGRRLYTDLTVREGLRIGTMLSIIREGHELKHPVTGRPLGQVDEEIGKARVVELRAAFSIAEIIEVKPGQEVRIKDRIRNATIR